MSPALEGDLVSAVTGGAFQHMPPSTDSSWTPGPVCTSGRAPQWLHLPPCSRASWSVAMHVSREKRPAPGFQPAFALTGKIPGLQGLADPTLPPPLPTPPPVPPKSGTRSQRPELELTRTCRHSSACSGWHDTLSCTPFEPTVHLGSHCPKSHDCWAGPAGSWPVATRPRVATQWQLENCGQAPSCVCVSSSVGVTRLHVPDRTSFDVRSLCLPTASVWSAILGSCPWFIYKHCAFV